MPSELGHEYDVAYNRLLKFGVRSTLVSALLMALAAAVAFASLFSPDIRFVPLTAVLAGLSVIAWLTVSMVVMVIVLDVVLYELRGKALLRNLLGEQASARPTGNGEAHGPSPPERLVRWIRENTDLLNLVLTAFTALGTVGAFVVAGLALWLAGSD